MPHFTPFFQGYIFRYEKVEFTVKLKVFFKEFNVVNYWGVRRSFNGANESNWV